jgi:hypothetical protein
VNGLTRGQQITTAAAHNSGVTVHSLLWPGPSDLVKYSLTTTIGYIRQALGPQSAAIGPALAALAADQAALSKLVVKVQ